MTKAIFLAGGLAVASIVTGMGALALTGSPGMADITVALCGLVSVREVLREYVGPDCWWLSPTMAARWLLTWPVSAAEGSYRWLRGFYRLYRHCVTSKWWPDYQGGKHPDIGDLSEWERAWSKVLDKGYQDAETVAPEPRYERRPR